MNSVIGGAFQSAYTLQRHHEEIDPTASGRQSRQSNISTMSTCTTSAYANTTKPLTTIDLNSRSASTSGPMGPPVGADICEETFSDFQPDYDPEADSYSVPIHTINTHEKPADFRHVTCHSTTVRSKLSAHSDGKLLVKKSGAICPHVRDYSNFRSKKYRS